MLKADVSTLMMYEDDGNGKANVQSERVNGHYVLRNYTLPFMVGALCALCANGAEAIEGTCS